MLYGQSVTHLTRPTTSNTAGEPGPSRTPTSTHQTPRTRRQSQARPRTPPPPPPRAPWGRHKQPASMGSGAEAVPTPSAEVVSPFFVLGKSAKKPLETRHLQNQLESERMTQNSVLGVNLERPHQKRRNQRSARQTLLETMICFTKRCGALFWEKTLKTPYTTARSWNVNGLLHRSGRKMSREKALKTSRSSTTTMRNWSVNVLQHPERRRSQDRRHFHQLIRQLRLTT